MTKVKLNINKAIFNDVYLPYLNDYSRRYNIYYGGAGSGKSVFIAQKLILKALKDKRKVLVVRKVGRTLKDSVFDLIIETLKKWQLYNGCKVNLSTYTVELANGSLFLFKGMDDSEKIKSITDISDIWCEEATELAEDDFTQLDLRLRAMAANLQIYCSFNPTSKLNWVYKRFFAPEVEIDTDTTFILKTTYKDNKFLPADYVAALEAKVKTNPNYYKIYTLGEFTTLDKLVFYNWKIQAFDYTEIKGQLMCGLDFGFISDVSAFVASLMDEENKRIYVFREWRGTNKTNQELAEIISTLGFSKSVIIADSAEQKSIEEIKRAGVLKIKPCTKGAGSIIYGIQKLQNYEIIIHPNCTGLIGEMNSYTWKKDKLTGEYTNTPVDFANHSIDALRYSLQCVGVKLKALDKNLF